MADALEYLDDQYARNAEIALLGDDAAVGRCQVLARRRWLIAALDTWVRRG